jgi:hypothetical protein
MRKIKRALDLLDVLNPGKIFSLRHARPDPPRMAPWRTAKAP